VNQLYGENQLIPRKGVYFSETEADGIRYASVTNIGVKPTVGAEANPLAETHILDYSGNLYGKSITVRLKEFVRDERKFSSAEELRRQIEKDTEYCRSMAGKE
jgi:riboflavin kinase/FMN adenylyltransferase